MKRVKGRYACRGFSLLETAIAVAAVGILLAVAVPRADAYLGRVAAIYEAECLVSDLRSLQAAARTMPTVNSAVGFADILAEYTPPSISFYSGRYAIRYLTTNVTRELIVTEHRYLPGITVSISPYRQEVNFNAAGGTGENFTINIRHRSQAKPIRKVILHNSGRIRVENSKD